jgi:pyrroline-5-carboxylate reductase
MPSKIKIGLLGAGNMSEAIMKGLIHSGINPQQISCSDISESRLQSIQENLKVQTSKNNLDVVSTSDVIFLAVKPNIVAAILHEVSALLNSEKLIISIAAGINIATIEKCLSNPVPVIRVMPNTPALVQEGMSAIAGGTHATKELLELATKLLSAIGKVVVLDEKQLDAVTGLSGSGPAYVLEFIDALASGGVKEGLRKDVALQLAAQTVLGTAKLYLMTGEHPSSLRDKVTSPGGTTIAGLYALESGHFRATVMNAVTSATKRSKELSQTDK